jgi:hypothetical protein
LGNILTAGYPLVAEGETVSSMIKTAKIFLVNFRH